MSVKNYEIDISIQNQTVIKFLLLEKILVEQTHKISI